MSNLFLERVLVRLADISLERRKSLVPDAFLDGKTKMSLSMAGFDDVKEDKNVVDEIEDAFSRSSRESILKAYWMTHNVKLEEVESRLVIGKPDTGVDLGDGYVVWQKETRKLSTIEISQIKGSVPGYFDDLVVFTGDVKDPDVLFERVLPTSMLTIVRPSTDHDFWLKWFGIDMTFNLVFEAAKKKFNLDQVYSTEEDPIVRIFGLTAK